MVDRYGPALIIVGPANPFSKCPPCMNLAQKEENRFVYLGNSLVQVEDGFSKDMCSNAFYTFMITNNVQSNRFCGTKSLVVQCFHEDRKSRSIQ